MLEPDLSSIFIQVESITLLLVTNISHHSTLSYSIFLVFKSLNGFSPF